MDFGFLSSWNEEVESMNEGKEGKPYRFPESYVSFLAFLKVGFDMTYREMQGVTRALSERIKPLEEMHFTHARRRIIRMVRRRKPSDMLKVEGGEPPTVIADSTRLSTTRKGSYIEAMWRKEKRKYGRMCIVGVAFSAFKGVLGEGFRAKRFISQKAEASLKVMLYNRFMSIRP